MTNNRSTFTALFTLIVAAGLLLSSCTPAPTATATATPARIPAHTPLPTLILEPGQFYFSLDGQPGFLFSRNVAGYQQTHYETLLEWTAAGGSRIARISLDSLGMGYTSSGEVEEAWARQWERIFDYAEANGVYILPVFSSWYDWNAGAGYSTWASNPLNAANGGPVQNPIELFEAGSPTQDLWLAWMETIVKRWQGRTNIAAWEIFSEVNLASNPAEAAGVDFINRAAALIRAADSSGRPVTASIADTGTWPNFYRDTAIDFINIHPYPPSAQLDRTIITEVRASLARYDRPVQIGESGLSAETPDSSAGVATIAENAPLGIRHAIWAGIVSGAMNGRALWWEDGVGIYFPSLGIPWMQNYKLAELPAVDFVQGVDFTGFAPLTVHYPGGTTIWGAAVGNQGSAIGWFRDALSEPPDWNLLPVLSGQSVTLTVPGTAQDWQVDYYDTKTGNAMSGSLLVSRQGNQVTIPLPDFTDDIAFKLFVNDAGFLVPPPTPAPEPTAIALTSTDPLAGEWVGSIFGEGSDFAAVLNVTIQPGCEVGSACGKVTTEWCSIDLVLNEIDGDTLVFSEQKVSSTSTCPEGGIDRIRLQQDGTLLFRYDSGTAGERASNGILHRK